MKLAFLSGVILGLFIGTAYVAWAVFESEAPSPSPIAFGRALRRQPIPSRTWNAEGEPDFV